MPIAPPLSHRRLRRGHGGLLEIALGTLLVTNASEKDSLLQSFEFDYYYCPIGWHVRGATDTGELTCMTIGPLDKSRPYQIYH